MLQVCYIMLRQYQQTLAFQENSSIQPNTLLHRRQWIKNLVTSSALITQILVDPIHKQHPPTAYADDDYNPPNMPGAPEERSGLVVLRVAEVCNFQEKILRAIVSKDIEEQVAPQQILFGTQILLRNSNIAGNMKLMIATEIPKKERDRASKNASKAMNTLQNICIFTGKIQRPLTDEEMLQIADMYRDARVQLNSLYEYLTPAGREKYYGYFMKVTDYEKKIADGVYNPDLDGVLKLEYD